MRIERPEYARQDERAVDMIRLLFGDAHYRREGGTVTPMLTDAEYEFARPALEAQKRLDAARREREHGED